MLAERDTYLSYGVQIGMRNKVEDMRPFIFQIKKNKLALIDVEQIDNRIGAAAKLLSNYEPEDILLVSRKENGHKPVHVFSELTGAKCVYGRFMPGLLTNPQSDNFIEPEILVVTDPEEDKQAINEAVDARIPIIAICDTANDLDWIDLVIPGNNKGRKSLGFIYYLLAREYRQAREEEFDLEPEDFIAEKKS